jgi:poly-gamma-glutamate synthesis protein (capsule biosynthesis protein)
MDKKVEKAKERAGCSMGKKQRNSGVTGSSIFILVAVLMLAAFICLYAGGKLMLGDIDNTENSTSVSASDIAAAADTPTSASEAQAASSVPTNPTVTTLRVSATGDNLIHDGLYLQARSNAGGDGYDFTSLYENIAPFYQNFDINWINQETLIADESVIAPSSYPCFATPSAMGYQLYNMGFRVISMSNNHSYDKGAAGIAATLDFWRTMPDDVVTTGFYAGESDYTNIPLQTVNGVTIAYLAYTYGTNGISLPVGSVANIITTDQEDVIEQQITLARQLADIVVVGVHWGTENSHIIHESQRTLGQKIANWGADIIIGTHPHVIQSIESFVDENTGKVVPVAYSLGNFVSTQTPADNLFGLILTFDITKTTQPDGSSQSSVSNVRAVPMVMYYDANYKNASAYLLWDYTDELAATHGNSKMTRSYITQVLQTYIDEQYLVMDPSAL